MRLFVDTHGSEQFVEMFNNGDLQPLDKVPLMDQLNQVLSHLHVNNNPNGAYLTFSEKDVIELIAASLLFKAFESHFIEPSWVLLVRALLPDGLEIVGFANGKEWRIQRQMWRGEILKKAS